VQNWQLLDFNTYQLVL